MASSSHVIMDELYMHASDVCLWTFIQGNAGEKGDAGIPGAAGLKVRASS